MSSKLRVSKKSRIVRFAQSPWGKALLGGALAIGVIGGSIFVHFYLKYAEIIQPKLEAGPFADMSVMYAAARPVSVGEPIEIAQVAAYLRKAGFSENTNLSRVGWFQVRPDGIEINPGPDATDNEGAAIKFADGKISQIISTSDRSDRRQYLLEPEPISNLFDEQREKRRIVRFDDIPAVMVNATLSAEDKRFFSHSGFDPMGIARAAYKYVTGQRLEGASTLTMQVARNLWLGTERGWERKIPESFITLHLERKLTKQEIFEHYANSIYVGNQGSFAVHGFAQGARAYFDKDLRDITLPEAALLAGLPQGPTPYNPFVHPDQAVARRNIVLRLMRNNEYITDEELNEALEAPLEVTRMGVETSDAPYFVDLVAETLRENRDTLGGLDLDAHPLKVYTTLNPDLQRDAVEAVRIAIEETDKQWLARNPDYGSDESPLAQVALVSLDAETGEVLAFVCGRRYGVSQLDHCAAKRQPGSSFKPFVYAAALNSALDPEAPEYLTTASVVMDEPTTFWFDEKPYEPKNHAQHYNGLITLREALAHSYNVPAVKIAEIIGYDKVVDMAEAVGLRGIKATPSAALGSYEVTPLDIAGAYTVFPNQGELIETSFIRSVREAVTGQEVYRSNPKHAQVMDPRVAYLTENLLEEVVRSGTGAGIRNRGFRLPAGGKTGTSFDGWFVGFTSKIITAVWVGFDDNRDFMLEGARSALPIWAEYMNRAHEHYQYSRVRRFEPPEGITAVQIDADTGELATADCVNVRTEVFITGTQPVQACRLHNHGGTFISGWDAVQTEAPNAEVVRANPAQRRRPNPSPRAKAGDSIPVTPQAQPAEEPKGIFGILKDIFN